MSRRTGARAAVADRVQVNARGYPIGQNHHNSTIPDVVVSIMRRLHEDEGLGYGAIARRFGISKSAVQKICNYRLRAQQPEGYRRINRRDEHGTTE